MFEGALARKDHRHLRLRLITGHDHLGVAQRTAGLGNGRHALGHGGVHAVAEGEKAVGNQARTRQSAARLGRARLNVGQLAGQSRICGSSSLLR